MPAEDFGWTTIAANAGTDWFIHGWGEGDGRKASFFCM
jgi:hypothetical protein